MLEGGFALLFNIISAQTLTNSSYLNTGERDCSFKPSQVSHIDFFDVFAHLGFSISNKSIWKQAVTLVDFLS